MKTNPAIDAYIEKAQPFAQPILHHLRSLVHKACPDVEEKVKWSMPFFDYKNQPLCNIAAFKQHAAFGFWKAALMKDTILMANAKEEKAMGHLGRITSLKDLPADKKIIAWIKEAMKLNDEGIKVKKTATRIASIETPDYILKRLKTNKAAIKNFEAFSNSCKKEYISWIEEAKTEATREKRLETALEWIAENKHRNWKYM